MGTGGDLADEQIPEERAESRGRHQEEGLGAGPQVSGRPAVEEDLAPTVKQAMPAPCSRVPATAIPSEGRSARLRNRSSQAAIPRARVVLMPNRRSSQGNATSSAISVVCPRVIAAVTQARGRPEASRYPGMTW